MKRALPILCILGALALTGCSGITANATYSQLIDQTAALSQETANRANAGGLSPDEMKAALTGQAKTWADIKAAKDGVAK